MNLRDKLRDILPELLPRREEEAIKGRELIARVRQVLGDTYSDGSLLTQFSLLSLEEDSCLARIPYGQGYYLRSAEDPMPSLHEIFAGQEEGQAELHRAIALAVRLYDTAGLSVFVYPVEEEESWSHPDLVAVQWPAGQWGADGAYTMDEAEERHPIYRAVCVEYADTPELCKRAFYRTLACGQWAQEMELLLLGPVGEAADELSRLAALYGVGVRTLAGKGKLAELPRAEAIFRAGQQEARSLLSHLQPEQLTHPRHRVAPPFSARETPDVQPVQEWAMQCVDRGRVEAYERRVAVN